MVLHKMEIALTEREICFYEDYEKVICMQHYHKFNILPCLSLDLYPFATKYDYRQRSERINDQLQKVKGKQNENSLFLIPLNTEFSKF